GRHPRAGYVQYLQYGRGHGPDRPRRRGGQGPGDPPRQRRARGLPSGRHRRRRGGRTVVKIAVLVSGGGTNLQALLDSEARGENPHGKITLVVASKPGVYALERAAKAGVESCVVSRKAYDSPEDFDAALLEALQSHDIGLVVLAGFLSVLGPSVVAAYPRRILNVHPALIPAFCGPGMYGLRPHQAALTRGCKVRSEEHTSELQSRFDLVCRLLLEKK